MSDERPLLDTVMAMTAASVERANMVDRELMLVRLAALAAVDVGLTVEDVQGVLIAIAPIVGSPRAVTAAGTITAALGLALGIDDAVTGPDVDDNS